MGDSNADLRIPENDSNIERIETITRKYSRRQQTAVKQIRKRVDNLTVLLSQMNNPCRKDLVAIKHHLDQAQNHLSMAMRATLEFERLARSADAESATIETRR
jgi:acetolactate synthase small subunit